MILPILKTHFSIGKSILTTEEPELPIINNKPTSIFSIAKLYDLTSLFVVDSSFSGFIGMYKLSNQLNIQLNFGFELRVCSDINQKDEASRKTESKVWIWLKNSAAYKDAIKIYSKAATDGFYYKSRIDWTHLRNMWTDNLSLVFPSYDNFIHKNLLENHASIPDYGKIKPTFFYSKMGLPFDYILEREIKNYSEKEKLEILEVHPVNYYSRQDFLAFCTFRCISNRSELSKPGLNHFSSDQFNWENYCEKTGIEFKN